MQNNFDCKGFRLADNRRDDSIKYSQFLYKGFIISIPHKEKLIDARIYSSAEENKLLHCTDTVQEAIEWIDMQQEPIDPRQGRELALCQFQDPATGKWYPFHGESHYEATKASGMWPIRYLSVD